MVTGQDQDLERRIEDRARHLWEAAGSPIGQLDSFKDEARTLIAIEDDPDAATWPLEETLRKGEAAEPVEAVENQGEFPELTDQGESSPLPKWPPQDDRGNNR